MRARITATPLAIMLRGVLLAVSACALMACNENKPRILQPDINFSFNVMEVPSDWPLEKRDWPKDPTEAAIRQSVYEKEGTPDYFRLRWRKDGRPVTTREVQQMLFLNDKTEPARNMKFFTKNQNLEMDWIYKDKSVIYEFDKKKTKKIDLSDELKTICDLGDPQDIKESIDTTQRPVTIYQYYDEGKVFYFRDGILLRQEMQPRMEGFHERR